MEKPPKLKIMLINRMIRAKKMTSEDLDSTVIDVALSNATSVNNRGLQAQVEFILGLITPDQFIKLLSSFPDITRGKVSDINSLLLGSSEATERAQPPKDMPAAIEETKTPEFNEPDGPDGTFISSEIYKDQVETCPMCNSRNILFLSYEEDDLYPQWECHDCGEIFYDSNYGQVTNEK